MTRRSGARAGCGGSLRALAACLVASALVVAFHARRVEAAFEVRDASPVALGAVSMDFDAEALSGLVAGDERGPAFGASHASLYQVAGLAADRIWVTSGSRGATASVVWSQAGAPGERESRFRVGLREAGTKRIGLDAAVERLELSLDGEPPAGGWALGVGARSTASLGRAVIMAAIGVDRFLRSGSLDRLGVWPSVPVSFSLRAGSAVIAWIDRWESDGRRSPRIVVEAVLAGAASIRLGRGENPERIGAAVSVRWRKLEVSAGRLDLSEGGTVSGFSLEWTRSASRGGS